MWVSCCSNATTYGPPRSRQSKMDQNRHRGSKERWEEGKRWIHDGSVLVRRTRNHHNFLLPSISYMFVCATTVYLELYRTVCIRYPIRASYLLNDSNCYLYRRHYCNIYRHVGGLVAYSLTWFHSRLASIARQQVKVQVPYSTVVASSKSRPEQNL